jgi:hypothetical protein
LRDRSIRSLAGLQSTGSSSRVLNLARLHQLSGDDPDYRARPLFKNPILNRALYVKHRLRENEIELFETYRTSATKILLPLDGEDLRSGGQSAFIGQRGYEKLLAQLVGDEGFEFQADRKVLEVLDRIPSLDPFLLREHLRRYGFAPAACYFDITPGDAKRMFAFMNKELSALVKLSMGGSSDAFAVSTGVLVQKILSNAAPEDMEPLRLVLRLDRSDFLEGLFCWKGFLYYKWRLVELVSGLPRLLHEIAGVQARGFAEPAVRAYVDESRGRIVRAIRTFVRAVEDALKVYDDAYIKLTGAGDPVAFREFLLEAPTMFVNLGERLGALDHVASFWSLRFRTLANGPGLLLFEELMDIFMDFEDSLGVSQNGFTMQSWGSFDRLPPPPQALAI